MVDTNRIKIGEINMMGGNNRSFRGLRDVVLQVCQPCRSFFLFNVVGPAACVTAPRASAGLPAALLQKALCGASCELCSTLTTAQYLLAGIAGPAGALYTQPRAFPEAGKACVCTSKAALLGVRRQRDYFSRFSLPWLCAQKEMCSV